MTSELPQSPSAAEVVRADPVLTDGSLGSPLGKSATLMLGYLVLLWIVELINSARDRDLIYDFGIVGRDWGRLPSILVAPFLHGNAEHLVTNATAVFTLGLIAALYGVWRFVGIFAVIVVIGGFVLWLIAPGNSVTVGASGVVFGLFGYLATRGIFDRRPVDIVVSLGVAVAFGYTIAVGMVPQDGQVSWQGHLAGFLAGVLAAWLFRRRRPKPTADATQPLPGVTPT